MINCKTYPIFFIWISKWINEYFRQGEHCICVGNGLAMSALYPEMRLPKMFLVPQFNKVLSCKTSWSKFPNENPTSFLVKKCFESFQLPPQPTNYPTNQLTKYSLNHLPHHPTIQIFNHPQQPSLHSAFHPSNQFTIQVSNHPSITPCPGSVGRLSPLTTFLVWITVCPGSCGFL